MQFELFMAENESLLNKFLLSKITRAVNCPPLLNPIVYMEKSPVLSSLKKPNFELKHLILSNSNLVSVLLSDEQLLDNYCHPGYE